jgi:hypothetical protein
MISRLPAASPCISRTRLPLPCVSVLMAPFLLNLQDPSVQAPAFSILASLAQAVPASSTPELNGLPFFSQQDHRLQRDCRLSPVLSG